MVVRIYSEVYQDEIVHLDLEDYLHLIHLKDCFHIFISLNVKFLSNFLGKFFVLVRECLLLFCEKMKGCRGLARLGLLCRCFLILDRLSSQGR